MAKLFRFTSQQGVRAPRATAIISVNFKSLALLPRDAAHGVTSFAKATYKAAGRSFDHAVEVGRARRSK